MLSDHKGTIIAPDGSVWEYEIGITRDACLLWVLHAPDKTHRAAVAPSTCTLQDVLAELHALVAARSLH